MRARKIWKLYWKRADLKWHGYDPHPEAANLAEALRVIDEDAFRCFLGRGMAWSRRVAVRTWRRYPPK